MNLDALYLVKPMFGKYFHFDVNRVADLLQLDAVCVPVSECVKKVVISQSGTVAAKATVLK